MVTVVVGQILLIGGANFFYLFFVCFLIKGTSFLKLF